MRPGARTHVLEPNRRRDCGGGGGQPADWPLQSASPASAPARSPSPRRCRPKTSACSRCRMRARPSGTSRTPAGSSRRSCCSAPPGYEAFEPRWHHLFNSYYEALGTRHPRAAARAAHAPLAGVGAPLPRARRAAVSTWSPWRTSTTWAAVQPLIELGLHHEQQHQELILTDILHALSCNPLLPAYESLEPSVRRPASRAPAMDLAARPGRSGAASAMPARTSRSTTRRRAIRCWLQPYRIADRLVTCGEFARVHRGWRLPHRFAVVV